MTRPIRLFFSYAHKDEELRDQLEVHLSTLRRLRLIEGWHDRRIQPGEDWSKAIDSNIESAGLVLLLVSADFIASDYCFGIEMQRAFALRAQRMLKIVPIILRECDWKLPPIDALQALPRDARPVTSWSNRDEAWTDIARGIRRIVGSSPPR